MSPEEAGQSRQRAIRQGRAMVRLIESADTLLENSGSWRETLLLKLARTLYQHRLKRVIGILPSDMSSEILAATESVGGNL